MKELVNTNEQIKKLVCSTSLFPTTMRGIVRQRKHRWSAKLWFKYQMLIKKKITELVDPDLQYKKALSVAIYQSVPT